MLVLGLVSCARGLVLVLVVSFLLALVPRVVGADIRRASGWLSGPAVPLPNGAGCWRRLLYAACGWRFA